MTDHAKGTLGRARPPRRSRAATPWLAVWISAWLPAHGHAAEPPGAEPDFSTSTAPFLRDHCLRCHGDEEEKGDLHVGRDLTDRFDDAFTAARWGEVVDALNSHAMPPEDEPQPSAEEVAAFVERVTGELAKAEIAARSTGTVLRRLNRNEFANTIRDLVGIEFDPEDLPADPPAGGFDNIGAALTMSPLHLELFYDAARGILDAALVEGDQPPAMKWRFEPEEDVEGGDRTWLRRDGQRVLLNKGNNRTEDGRVVMRVDRWDTGLNVRLFTVPHAGRFLLRLAVSTRVPSRDEVVAATRRILTEHERKEADEKGRTFDEAAFGAELEERLAHFEDDRMYDYGPARLRIVRTLGGQPENVAEFDVTARHPESGIVEIPMDFTTESAGITIAYAYSIPKVLENFWFQDRDEFPRPEALVDWIELEGPVFESWPPTSHLRVLGEIGETFADETAERAAAREVLARFMKRAWRRPVSTDEIEAKLALFDSVRPGKASFVEAIKAPLAAVIASPHFLYLPEPSGDPPSEGGSIPLDGWQVAARLSYFLWSSMPDEELAARAESGGLAEPSALEAQADRLLADPRAFALSANFAGQWLGLRQVGANPPVENLFPRYDRHLESSMVGESQAFFREVLEHDLDVRRFIRAEFVTVNERMARFYGIPGVRGDAFRRVGVTPDIRRGGLLTQASILTTTSNGTRTSPVVRGTWILRNLLATDPGLPVANAGEIAPKVPGIDKATVRQRLEIHRELSQCARCHDRIDPLGFALENFDASGEWRDREGFGYNGRIGDDDPPIDASGRLPDGTTFVGVDGLQDVLLERDDLFLECLVRKMLTYALGRELGFADVPAVKAGVARLADGPPTLRNLIHFIVTHDAFLTR